MDKDKESAPSSANPFLSAKTPKTNRGVSPAPSTKDGQANGDASDTKECPFCAETIKAAAKKCKHCGEMLKGETEAQDSTQRPASEGDFLDKLNQDSPVVTPNQMLGGFGCFVVAILMFLSIGPKHEPTSSEKERLERIAASQAAEEQASKTVVYRVTGTGAYVDLTYRNKSGGTDQKSVSTPWEYKFTGNPGDHLYISAQTDKYGTPIKAEILVGGRVLYQGGASKEHGIATASGQLYQ